MKRSLIGVGVLLVLAAIAGEAGGTRTATDSWVGTYTLGGQGQISLTVSGKRAFVALGVGHADLQSVPLIASGAKLRFQLPGRPAPLVFDGTVAGWRADGNGAPGSLARHVLGSARQRAGARGSRLLRDRRRPDGRHRRPVRPCPHRRPRLRQGARDLPVGRRVLDRLRLRHALAEHGTARFGTGAALIDGKQAARVGVRQLEVQFRSGATRLSGTLLIPPGAGKHAGAVFVHGSGPTQRAYLPELSAMLVRHGVAVLVYDKRGIGQSSGSLSRRVAHGGRDRHAGPRRRRQRRASSPRSPRSIRSGSG